MLHPFSNNKRGYESICDFPLKSQKSDNRESSYCSENDSYFLVSEINDSDISDYVIDETHPFESEIQHIVSNVTSEVCCCPRERFLNVKNLLPHDIIFAELDYKNNSDDYLPNGIVLYRLTAPSSDVMDICIDKICKYFLSMHMNYTCSTEMTLVSKESTLSNIYNFLTKKLQFDGCNKKICKVIILYIAFFKLTFVISYHRLFSTAIHMKCHRQIQY